MPDRLIVDLGTDGLATIGVEPGGGLYERVSQASLAWPLDADADADALEDLRWYLEDYLLAPVGVWEDRGPAGWMTCGWCSGIRSSPGEPPSA